MWLSEIMLQQTTVAAVEPYFRVFIARWPTLADLAQADLNDVLTAWAGLGYYARVHSLHKCAQAIAVTGTFPTDEKALRRLPGIGAYTAAAIAAIAFGRRAVAVDGNIERVITRLCAVTEPLPTARPRIHTLADALMPESRCGDFIQAAMDLGAMLCTPRQPVCMLCPLQPVCAAHRQGLAGSLPARANKSPRPIRQGLAFVAVRKDGAIFLRRRPQKGLLGGMMEIPSTPWRPESWMLKEAVSLAAPLSLFWQLLPGMVRHVFTHFQLDLKVAIAHAGPDPAAHGIWIAPEQMGEQALPSVMRKVLAHALRYGY
ncbi:MAG: A/G-specific adenine glycosylase [Rhodospirillaceae bacterium]|nr:MAG: A/G-specific adenine glycosylase [Rhodospirillaceae bacterium]